MLKFLRDHANSWIMKVLLGILILSFGLFWGVSEFFRGTDKSNIVASIGKIEISKQHLIQSVQEELRKLNKELKGKNVSFAQALQVGLVGQHLNRMVHEIVLDMFMKDINLSVSDQTIASLIYADPLFQDSQGNFDKERFQNILRANGVSEKSFFANRRRSLGQMHLLTALSVGGYSPGALSFPVFQALTQKRSFHIATVSESRIQVAYTEQDLKKFYEDHPDYFKVPEYRDFKLILLDAAKIASRLSVSDQEIQQAYNDQKENYVTPETRSFSLVVCQNGAEAQDLKKQLQNGVLADKKRQQDYEKISAASLDRPLADVVFKLTKGQVSEPFEWRKKIVLVRLNSIVPTMTSSLNEVREQLVGELKRQKAGDEISRIGQQIEEGANQGLSLTEIAKKYGLSIQSGRIDMSGRVEGASSVTLSPDIVKDIFTLSEGSETPLTELPDGVSYLVSVAKILPGHLESFEKVRPKVMREFISQKKQQEAQKIAEMVKEKMNSGQTVKHEAVHILETPKVSITEATDKIKMPEVVLQRGFSLPKGAAEVVVNRGRFENVAYLTYHVISPLTIETIPIEKNLGLYKAYKQDLGKSLVQTLSTGMMEALKKEYKVETYPAVVASLKE